LLQKIVTVEGAFSFNITSWHVSFDTLY